VTVNTSNNMYITVGFAPSKLYNVSKPNHFLCGWYLYLNDGTLVSQDGDSGKAYSSGCKVGDTITCIYDALTRRMVCL
jgi:hypothetical protein